MDRAYFLSDLIWYLFRLFSLSERLKLFKYFSLCHPTVVVLVYINAELIFKQAVIA